MTYDRIIKGDTTEAVWEQVANDLISNPDALEYKALIEQEGRKVYLSIDIDPGGGFEGGFESTTISAPVSSATKRFAIHHEGFFDEVGKFLGVQDIITGYAEFDRKVVVKGSDENYVKQVFSKESVRFAFEELHGFSFGIRDHRFGDDNEVGTLLEFEIEEALIEPERLYPIYRAFVEVLLQCQAAEVAV